MASRFGVLALTLFLALARSSGAAAVTKRGDRKPNRISGTAKADRLYGGGGKDTLRGFAGNDLLDGGASADYLSLA